MPLHFPKSVIQRSKCEPQDRQELFSVVQTFQKYVRQARREGSLCLEQYLDADIEPDIHRIGIECIVDGTRAEDVADILMKIVRASDHTGRDLLHRLLIAEGIHCISTKKSSEETLSLMQSLLGGHPVEHDDPEGQRR